MKRSKTYLCQRPESLSLLDVYPAPQLCLCQAQHYGRYRIYLAAVLLRTASPDSQGAPSTRLCHTGRGTANGGRLDAVIDPLIGY